jgi:hemolysin D
MSEKIQAFKELFGRYKEAWMAAWSVRDKLDPPKRTEDELAFLPAHLELVETPVSPLPKVVIRVLIAVCIVALLWVVIGKLDIVAVANGKTVPGSRTKVIQPLEAAVVKEILVRDGQHVEAGDVLVELDTAITGAEARKASEALISARGAQARYQAVLDALDTGKSPVAFTFPGSKVEIDTANRLAQSEYRTFIARRDSLGSQVAQRQAELATTRGLITHLEESARIAQSRSKDMQQLLAKKFISQHDFLTQEQNRIAAERDLDGQRSRVYELEAAIAVQRDERLALEADFRRQVTDGLRQSREQGAQFVEEAGKTERLDQLKRLRAPVSGTVQQLAIHTVGGVVTPAQPLMAIVPDGETIEVEAMVENKDIGFVREGQPVTVKVQSFPYTRYGTVNGTVVSVSDDAIQDEKLGLVYQARVRLAKSQLNIDGKMLDLGAGMAVSAEIKTGKRRVISYLLSPLQQHASEALRER